MASILIIKQLIQNHITPLVTIMIILFITPIFISFFISKKKIFTIALLATTFCFYLTLIIYYNFNFAIINEFQQIVGISSISLLFGIDHLSLIFLMLTCFIMPICIYNSFSIQKDYKTFIIYLLLIQISLVLSFIALNLLVFYIFFESVLIPMFLVIGNWGARSRKMKAAYYLFIYTLIGSFFLLTAIVIIFINYGTVNFDIILNLTSLTETESHVLWWLLFLPFAVKIPMFPFHLWLPEAHVEAPTIGSVILASLLLKLGGYGMLRILFPITENLTTYYPFAYALALGSVIFASLSAIRQTDLKRIIAYSSIAHMNIIILGLFSQTKQGIDGAIYLMIGHAFVSSLLFLCVGVLYDRHHTRLLRYFGGVAQVMPVFSTIFFIGTLANMSFPGTCNFLGEFLIFIGLLIPISTYSKIFVLICSSASIVLSAIYSIWLFNRVTFGTLKTKYINKFVDLTFKEILTFLTLIILIILFGLHLNIC